MSQFIVSSTEPKLIINSLGGICSTVPERYGADIIWSEEKVGGIVGVQRKEFSDLLGSMSDGRLAKELAQLQSCKMSVLIIEGKPHWSADGKVLIHRYHKMMRSQYRGLVRSIQNQGIIVEFSDNTADTILLVEEIATWAGKDGHYSLERRPRDVKDSWGRSSNELWLKYFLQGIPGVGPKTALDITRHFDGKLPITWTVTRDEFSKIKGVGPKTVDALGSAVQFKE